MLSLGVEVKPLGAELFVPQVASKLGLPPKAELLAKRAIALAREKGLLSGRSPRVVAAGALYYAAKLLSLGVTERKVALASGVCEHSIRDVAGLLGGLAQGAAGDG